MNFTKLANAFLSEMVVRLEVEGGLESLSSLIQLP